MLLKYADREITTDQFTSYKEVIRYLDNIEPMNEIDVAGLEPKEPGELFAPFDFLNGKEKAIISFIIVARSELRTLREKISPKNEELFESLSKLLIPDKVIDKKPIDPELWSDYNKLGFICNIATDYLQYSLYSRLGFENFICYEVNGQVSTIKDLRNVFQAQQTF